MTHPLRFAVVATMVACVASAGCRTVASDPKTPAAAVKSAETAWLILIDDLHISFRDTGYLREVLATISKELIRQRDVYAVASTGPSDVSIRPTADRSLLDAAIKK